MGDDYFERVKAWEEAMQRGETPQAQNEDPYYAKVREWEELEAANAPPPPPPGPGELEAIRQQEGIPEYIEPGFGRTMQTMKGAVQNLPSAIQGLPGYLGNMATGIGGAIAGGIDNLVGGAKESIDRQGIEQGFVEAPPVEDIPPELQQGYAIDELPEEDLADKHLREMREGILRELTEAGVIDEEGALDAKFAFAEGAQGSILNDWAMGLVTRLKGGDPEAIKKAGETVQGMIRAGVLEPRAGMQALGAISATMLDVMATHSVVGAIPGSKAAGEGLKAAFGRRKVGTAIGGIEGLGADIARAARREDEGAGTVAFGTAIGGAFGAVFPGGQALSGEVQKLVKEAIDEAGGRGEAEAVKRFYQKIAKTPTEAVIRMPDGTIVGEGQGLRSHIEGSFHEDGAIRDEWTVASQNGGQPGFLTREGTFLYGQGTVDQPTGFGHVVPEDQKMLPPPRRTEAGEIIFEGQPPGKLQEEEIARGMGRGREAAERIRQARAAEEERLVAEGRSLPPGPAPESRQIGRGRVAVEEPEGVTMKTVREAGPIPEEMTDADFIRFARQVAEEARRAREAEIEAGRTLPEPAPKSRQIPARSSAEPEIREAPGVEERVLTDFEGQMPARRPAPESRQIPPRTEGGLARGREAEAFREGESLREGVRQTSRLTEDLRRGRAAGTIPELPPAPREAPPTPAPKAEAPAPKHAPKGAKPKPKPKHAPKPKAKPKPKRAKDMTADELKEAARKADEGVRATQEKFGIAKPKPKAAPKETAAPGFTKTQTEALQKAGVDPATLNTSEGIEVARRQMMEAFWDLAPADKPAHKGAQGVLNKMAKEGPTALEPTPAKAPARAATKPAPAPEGKVADGHPAPSVKKSSDFSESGEWIVQDAVNPMQRHTRIFYDQQSGMWHEVVPKKGGKGNDFVPIPSKNKAEALDIIRQRWAGERAEALAKRGPKPKPKPKPKADVKVKPKGMGYKNQWTLTSGDETTVIERGRYHNTAGWWEVKTADDGTVKRSFLTDSDKRTDAVNMVAERWGETKPKPKAKPKAKPKEAPKAEEPKDAGRMWKDLDPVDEGGEVIIKVADEPVRGKVVTNWKKGRLKYTVEITEGPSKGKLVAGLRRSDLDPVPPKAEPKPAVKEMPKAKPKGKPTQTEEDQLNFFDRAFEVKNGRYIDPKRGGVIHPLVVREMSRAGLGAVGGAAFNLFFSDETPGTSAKDRIITGALIGSTVLMGAKTISVLGRNNKAWQTWMTGGGKLVGTSKRFGNQAYQDVKRAVASLGGRAAQGERKITQAAGDLFEAVRAEYGKGPRRMVGITAKDNPFAVIQREAPEVYEAVKKYMNGDGGLDAVPEKLRAPIMKMRNGIDDMQRYMVSEGLVEGPVVAKFKDGIGSYLTRAYRMFDDSKWMTGRRADGTWVAPHGVDELEWNKVVNRFKTWYHENAAALGKDLTDEELDAAVLQFMSKGGHDNPISFLANRKLGRINLTDLAKKNEKLAPEVRALWGEYDDPWINFVRSMTKQHQYVANAEWLGKIKDAGLKGKFAIKGEGLLPDGTAGHFIPENDFRYGALRGHTVHSEFYEAMEEQLMASPLKDGISKHYLALMSWSKVAKTVGSPVTHVRNTVGNTSFAIINGYNPATFTRLGWQSVGDVLAASGWRNPSKSRLFKATDRDWINDLVKLGVLDDNANAAELEAAIKAVSDVSWVDVWAGKGNLDKIVGDKLRGVRRFGRVVYGAAQTAYRAEDDLWKIVSWQVERARYAAADPTMSKEALDQLAADITRDVFPTFSLTNAAVTKIRKWGGFISFPAEVYRTTKNTIAQAQKELKSKNPAIRKIGWTRVAGMTSYTTALSGITALSKWRFGISDEEEDAVRSTTMWWNENSNLMFFGKIEDGKYKYIDTSYMFPHSYFMDPLNAMLRGEKWENTLAGVVKEVLQPWVGGAPLFSELVKATEEAHLAADYEHPYIQAFINGMTPGAWDQFSRILLGEAAGGRTVHRGTELFAVATGLRGTITDSRESTRYVFRSLGLRASRQERPYDQAMEKGGAGGRWGRAIGGVTDKAIGFLKEEVAEKIASNLPGPVQGYLNDRLKTKAEKAIANHILAAAEMARASIILGVPAEEVDGWLSDARVPIRYRGLIIEAAVMGLRRTSF